MRLVVLSISCLVVSGALLASQEQPIVSELLLFNGKIVTVNSSFSIADTMAVRDGRIVAVGSLSEVERRAGANTKRIDLKGRTVTPGFIDGHPHLYTPTDTPLDRVTSVKEILEIVRQEAAKRRPGEWILLEPPGEPPYHFHMPERLAERRLPSRDELDAAAPQHPVYLKSSAFHERPMQVFNSLALQQLGITRESGPIKGVEILRRSDGTPNGEIVGNVSYFSQSPLVAQLQKIGRRPTLDEQLEQLRSDIRRHHAGGVTGIYEAHGMPDSTIALFNELWSRGELNIRSYMVKTVNQFAPTDQVIRQLDAFAAFRGPGFGDDFLKVGGIGLIFGDNVGFGAGFMREPYVGYYGEKWQGLQLIDEEKLYEIVKAAAERNIRVNMQASGGKAIDITLAVFDRVNREIPISDRRFVLEHCQFVSRQNMLDVKRLGIIPTTATNFLWGQGDAYIKYYGHELANQAIPLRTWIEADVPIAQSTDYGPDGAMFTLWQSMARKNGWTGETLGAKETITREQAIRIYTINAARLGYWDKDLGSLEPGKLADFVLLDRDILTVPLDQIREARVLATVVAGKVVHGALD